jgi:hypothetical protein
MIVRIPVCLHDIDSAAAIHVQPSSNCRSMAAIRYLAPFILSVLSRVPALSSLAFICFSFLCSRIVNTRTSPSVA